MEAKDEIDTHRMTARMLRQAASLNRAAEILYQVGNKPADKSHGDDFSAVFHGVPILRAQSAEIALKALWYIGRHREDGGPPRSHNLTKLHDVLPEKIQKLLVAAFPEISDPSSPHLPPVRQGLRAVLNEHEDALKQWRYTYEYDSLRFENVFDEVLKTLMNTGWQLHTEWLNKLQAQGNPS
ncbi:MAG: hypothetical protein OXC17_14270 [Aestuariivita sp.]|nr:hypothetical protein [Aestuariivita sp.]